MKKITLVQIPEKPAYTLKNFRRNHMNIPLFGAYVSALAKKYFPACPAVETVNQDWVDLGGDAFLIERLARSDADIFWFPYLSETNWNRSMYIAGHLRKINGRVKIIGAGPEIPFNADSLLAKSLDISIFSREDKTIIETLGNIFNNNPSLAQINGIAYGDNGKRRVNFMQNNFNAVSNTPSPYLMGLVPSAFAHKQAWIEAKRGCPHTCAYCYQGAANISKNSFFSLNRLEKELKLFKEKGVKEVCVLDSTFNYPQKWFRDAAKLIKKINKGEKFTLDCCLRADYVDETGAKLLKEAGFTLATVGIQTLNEEALKNVHRKNALKNWLNGVRLMLQNDIGLHIHLMIGLPDDTLKSFKYSLDFLAAEGLTHHVTIFSLFLTPVSHMYAKGSPKNIRFQKSPPHLFLGSPSFAFGEVKEALNTAFDMGCGTILEALSPNSHPQLITGLNSGNDQGASALCSPRSGLNHPVTRIIIDLDGAPEDKIYSQIPQWALTLANSVVIWFKSENLSKKIGVMKKVMKTLSSPNPYTVWNIVLESDRAVTKKTCDAIEKEIFYHPHNLDYEGIYFADNADKEYYRCATRFYIVYNRRGRIYATPTIKYHFYYSLNLRKSDNIENKTKEALIEDCDGILFDFDKDFGTSAIKKIMAFIKENNWRKKIVQFRGQDLQSLWDLKFEGKPETEGQEEYIINSSGQGKNNL